MKTIPIDLDEKKVPYRSTIFFLKMSDKGFNYLDVWGHPEKIMEAVNNQEPFKVCMAYFRFRRVVNMEVLEQPELLQYYYISPFLISHVCKDNA